MKRKTVGWRQDHRLRIRWLLWIRLNLKGDFFYVLTFRPPLAFIFSWGKSLTPHCGSTALCQAQGPVSVSSLILGVDSLLMVQPVLVSFTFSPFKNTKTISVWHCSSFSYHQATMTQAVCHPSSLGSERSPHPLLTVSLMLPRFIAWVSIAIRRNQCRSSWVILSPSLFPSF